VAHLSRGAADVAGGRAVIEVHGNELLRCQMLLQHAMHCLRCGDGARCVVGEQLLGALREAGGQGVTACL
jgi:hypothetical protein